MAKTRTYGGRDAAERMAFRRSQLLEAALDLLGGEGSQACTVRAICGRAKLTPRYFYESFPDLDGLMLALFDDIAAQAASQVLEAVERAPLRARAKSRAAIGAFVSFVCDDRRRARVLFSEAMGSELLVRRRFETVRTFAVLVADQGRRFYGLPADDDPRIELGALMLVGGLSETLLAWLDGTLSLDREQLIEECTELFVATGEVSVGRVGGNAR